MSAAPAELCIGCESRLHLQAGGSDRMVWSSMAAVGARQSVVKMVTLALLCPSQIEAEEARAKLSRALVLGKEAYGW